MNIRKTILASTIVVALAATTQASAKEAVSVDKISNAWTQCGIGAMIFKELPVAAAISNIIWDWGTTAVTSMLASPETCKGVNVAAAVFINESINSIESDAAQGQGAHLTAMLTLMGVEATHHAKATQMIRDNIAHNAEFLALETTAKAQAMYVMAEQAKLAS